MQLISYSDILICTRVGPREYSCVCPYHFILRITQRDYLVILLSSMSVEVGTFLFGIRVGLNNTNHKET